MNTSAIDKAASARLSYWLIGLGLGGPVWVAAYTRLAMFADAVVGALGLSRQTHLGEAIHFFFCDTPKVLLLLTGIVFVMGVIRTFLSPERTRSLLSGKHEGVGNVLAVTLGSSHRSARARPGAAGGHRRRFGNRPVEDGTLPR